MALGHSPLLSPSANSTDAFSFSYLFIRLHPHFQRPVQSISLYYLDPSEPLWLCHFPHPKGPTPSGRMSAHMWVDPCPGCSSEGPACWEQSTKPGQVRTRGPGAEVHPLWNPSTQLSPSWLYAFSLMLNVWTNMNCQLSELYVCQPHIMWFRSRRGTFPATKRLFSTRFLPVRPGSNHQSTRFHVA